MELKKHENHLSFKEFEIMKKDMEKDDESEEIVMESELFLTKYPDTDSKFPDKLVIHIKSKDIVNNKFDSDAIFALDEKYAKILLNFLKEIYE